MAITKLSNIGMPQGGGAAHLKNCITYIMNPAKTGRNDRRKFRDYSAGSLSGHA